MLLMKNLNKTKELKTKLNNTKKNCNIVMMKIKLIKIEEKLGKFFYYYYSNKNLNLYYLIYLSIFK